MTQLPMREGERMGHENIVWLLGSTEGSFELMVVNLVELVIMIIQPCLAAW